MVVYEFGIDCRAERCIPRWGRSLVLVNLVDEVVVRSAGVHDYHDGNPEEENDAGTQEDAACIEFQTQAWHGVSVDVLECKVRIVQQQEVNAQTQQCCQKCKYDGRRQDALWQPVHRYELIAIASMV